MTDAMTILADFLRQHGTLDLQGLAILCLVFATTGSVPIPRTALCIVSGTVYGPWAIPVILPATTLGGVIPFLAARYLLSRRLYHLAEGRRQWRAVLRAVDEEGWRIVGLMRFASAMPTFSQNYLFGLTRIGLLPYTVASFLFTIPQVALYVYIGSLGRAALLNDTGSPVAVALLLLGAVSLVTVFVVVTYKTRKVLQSELAADLQRLEKNIMPQGVTE